MCVDAVCGAKQASTGVFWGVGGLWVRSEKRRLRLTAPPFLLHTYAGMASRSGSRNAKKEKRDQLLPQKFDETSGRTDAMMASEYMWEMQGQEHAG